MAKSWIAASSCSDMYRMVRRRSAPWAYIQVMLVGGWQVADGVITLVLGFHVLAQWPASGFTLAPGCNSETDYSDLVRH